MTKCLVTMCVFLGGATLLVGCAGPASAPPQPQPRVVQTPEPASEPAAIEPNETTSGQSDAVTTEGPDMPAASQTETPAATDNKPAEPNETKPAESRAPAVAEPNTVKSEPLNNPQSEIPNPQSAAPAEPNAPANPQWLSAYAELLKANVQEDGSVDYANLHRHRLDLKQTLMGLGELDPNSYKGWSNDEKLAFWINVYNLKLLDIIARNYPIQSSRWLRLTWPPSDIRHIAGIWTDYKCIVMGEEFTLAEVEQRFFHRQFNEPRAYLAISYACRSGPPLRRTPYDGEHLSQQLDEQTKAFLTSGQGLQIDHQTPTVRLSAIFKPAWRGKEFVARWGTDKKFKAHPPETRAVLNFLTNYLSRDDAYFLETENYTLESPSFDWRLNDTSRGY